MQYNGPAVLPWLWQPVEQDGEVILQPQPIPHIAGPSGNTPSCPICLCIKMHFLVPSGSDPIPSE